MILTIDFHTHLLEKGVLPSAYWEAVKAKGLNAVAITEHVDEKPETAYRALLETKPGNVLLIPGMELNTSIGHVLAFGSNESIYQIKELFKKRVPIEEAIEAAKRNSILLSIAHPWGFSADSAAFILGEKKLETLVQKEKIGVESFNGMFGNVSEFFYATNWVKKPMNFFDFLEKSRIGKKTRLDRLGRKGMEKLDKKGKEILERCKKPYELAEKAYFVTAGSDGHSPKKIGTGIVKLEVKGKGIEGLLKALQNRKNVKWLGPHVVETAEGYEINRLGIQKKEVLSGLKYVAKRTLQKKISGKKKQV